MVEWYMSMRSNKKSGRNEDLFRRGANQDTESGAYESHRKARKAHNKKQKLIIAASVVGVISLCLIGVAIYVNNMIKNPQSLFPTADVTATPGTSSTPTGTAEPTVDLYQQMYEQADKSMMSNTLNI